MTTDSKQSPTKKFLLEQIESCKQAIYQNQGAINLCKAMINSGCFVEDVEVVKGEKSEGTNADPAW